MSKRPAIKPPEHRTYPRRSAAPPKAAAPSRAPRWQRPVPPDRSFPRAPARQA